MGTAGTYQVCAPIGIINDITSIMFCDMPHFVGVNGNFGTKDHPLIKLVSSDSILAGSDRKSHPEQVKINPVKPIQ